MNGSCLKITYVKKESVDLKEALRFTKVNVVNGNESISEVIEGSIIYTALLKKAVKKE